MEKNGIAQCLLEKGEKMEQKKNNAIEKVENINSVSTTEDSVSKILKRKVAIGRFSNETQYIVYKQKGLPFYVADLHKFSLFYVYFSCFVTNNTIIFIHNIFAVK